MKKNIYIENDDYYTIEVYYKEQKYDVLIDKDDYETVKKYHWRAEPHHGNVYVLTEKGTGGVNKKKIRLHKLVMGDLGSKNSVDHINGNGLDNRKSNLRISTVQLNNCNKTKMQSNNTSGVVGVRIHKNAWNAEWVDYETGKTKQRSFSINKYGYEEAKEMAIKVRKEAEEKNKLILEEKYKTETFND